MKPIRYLVAASSLLLGLATQSSADTFVGGDVEIDAETGAVVTVSIGSDAKAVTNIGSVLDDTVIGGDVEISVKTKDVITVALGKDARACANIASVGARHDCE